MINVLLSFLVAVGAGYGKPGYTGKVAGAKLSTGLPVGTCSGTCDLQFVADDWSGSGNWSARVGGWTATVTGAPTKQATSQFPGRSEIAGCTTTNAFRIAANAAHTVQLTDSISYEWVIKTPSAVTTLKSVGGYIAAGTAQIFNPGYINSVGGNIESAVYNSAIAIYLGSTAASAWKMPLKYNIFHLVMDVAAPRYEVYVNGVSVFEDTSTSGTMVPTNSDFGICARWNSPSATFQNAMTEGATTVEITRYRQAWSDADVAARAATFNAVKGY